MNCCRIVRYDDDHWRTNASLQRCVQNVRSHSRKQLTYLGHDDLYGRSGEGTHAQGSGISSHPSHPNACGDGRHYGRLAVLEEDSYACACNYIHVPGTERYKHTLNDDH